MLLVDQDAVGEEAPFDAAGLLETSNFLVYLVDVDEAMRTEEVATLGAAGG